MTFLKSLTIRGKLTVAFGFVLFLLAVLGGLTVMQLERVYAKADQIITVRLAGVRDSARMAEAATRIRTGEFRLATIKPADAPAAMEGYRQDLAEFDAARTAFAGALHDDDEEKLYAAAMAAWGDYMNNSGRLVAQAQAGQPDEALATVHGAAKPFGAALDAIHALTRYNDDGANVDAGLAKRYYPNSRWVVLAFVLVAAVFAFVMGMAISRAISRPLDAAVELARAVADGDLTRSIDESGKDEIGQMSRALAAMVARLRGIVTEVRLGVESVSTAASQIATGNIDLSQRTEEQASNLQQTAASMEELTSTVKQNADNARAAAQLANGATAVAARGGQVVGEVADRMDAITQSSRRIADIIGVIDGIAFQTNILALNAAVEAARAGEQGRGFAVVASEVRGLAQRSAQAAKEIKSLIEDSVEKVGSGATLVAEAGRTMSDIVAQVRKVSDLVSEIGAASIEQSRGIEQVGQAVNQLDQVTQQNAALVEESAAAADSMQQQATQLSQAMAVFNVGGAALEDTARTPRASPVRKPASASWESF
jgi:methyl-accepting chemotaxis protein